MTLTKTWFKYLQTSVITLIVLASFIASSIGWRHIESTEVLRISLAGLILFIVYMLMILELVNRNLAALIGAAMSVAAYDCLIEPLDKQELFEWEDLDTISLLLGMMVIVGILKSSGVFEFLAVCCYKWSSGRFWLLIVVLSMVTAIISALLDNVSTMLLMSPTLVKLGELERIDPRYLLMIMTVVSNIGGCATPIGDPPNLIIVGDAMISSLGITFSSFTAYCTPCVLLTLLSLFIYLKLVFKSRESFASQNNQLESNQDRARSSTTSQLADSGGVNGHFEANLGGQKGDQQLNLPGGNDPEQGGDLETSYLMRLPEIKSKPILFQTLAVLAFALPLFFLQSWPELKLTIGYVSLFAALVLLITSSSIEQPADSSDSNKNEDRFDAIISKVEWSTLMFFFSLFLVMEVMAKLGLIAFMADGINNLVELIPAGHLRSVGAITIFLWSSAIASALIDNVPFTSMMVKLLGSLIAKSRLDTGSGALETRPLVFALAFGTCFGGNGSLIGASANLVTAGVSGRYGYPISFNQFFKFGAPITLLTMIVANVYLVIVFVVLKL